MNRKLMLWLCILILTALGGCQSSKVSNTKTISQEIPSNSSVNTAWGGYMCEATGYVYYVSAVNNKEKIVRMDQDGGNPITITTGEYDCIHELTLDGAYLYFVSSVGENSMDTYYHMNTTDTIFRLPIHGGKEVKIAQGHVFNLQSANGMLYWVDDAPPNKINCMNSDGSDLHTILSSPADISSGSLDFLVAGENIYYFIGAYEANISTIKDDIFRMDLNGKNVNRLNRGALDAVCALFYDQGKLYFLTEHFNGDPAVGSRLETLDEKGNAEVIVDKVGYYSEKNNRNAFCGISNGVFYYFDLPQMDSNQQHISMNLHQFDLTEKKDTVILRQSDVFSGVGTIISVRGKSIQNKGVTGLYILGNDLFFSPDPLNKDF